MTSNTKTLLATILAAASLIPAGCRTSGVDARRLPAEFLARPGGQQQEMQLFGLASSGGSSSAVGVDDVLEVTIDSGLTGEVHEPVLLRVDNAGAITVPHVGLVQVAGLEPGAAANAVAQTAISRQVYRRPDVQLTIAEQAANQITVLGAVAEPGVHDVPRSDCGIITAIAAAGGFTEEAGAVVDVMRSNSAGTSFANQSPGDPEDGIRLASYAGAEGGTTDVSQPERFNLADLRNQPPARQWLGDRDVVFVRPRERRVVHVSGLVKSPNQFEMTEDHTLRLLDAIAMAGGVTTQVADKVFVLRNTPGREEPVLIVTSLGRAKKDGAENLVLQSGDLVSVESTAATTVVETFNQLFRISMGVGGNLSFF